MDCRYFESEIFMKAGLFRISQFTGKFIDATVERDFNTVDLSNKIYLSRVFYILALFVTLLFAYFDQFLITDPYYPYSVLTVRLLNAAFIVIALFQLKKIDTYDAYVKLTTLVITSILTSLVVAELMLEPNQDIYVQFDAIIIICLFAAPFLTATRVAVLMGIFAFISSAIMLSLKGFSAVQTQLGILAYVFAYVIGYVISIHIGFSRRLDYKNRMRLNAQSEELREFAYRDLLTGLHNRRSYVDHFAKYLDFVARSRCDDDGVFIIVTDIDLFKNVNDQHGHEAGDDVLMSFSNLLSSTIRPSDGLYRYGGEEFVIVLSQCPKAIAIQRIENIIQRLNDREIFVYPVKQLITASFGMTQILPTDDCDSATARADELLYAAKNKGRNCLVHD